MICQVCWASSCERNGPVLVMKSYEGNISNAIYGNSNPDLNIRGMAFTIRNNDHNNCASCKCLGFAGLWANNCAMVILNSKGRPCKVRGGSRIFLRRGCTSKEWRHWRLGWKNLKANTYIRRRKLHLKGWGGGAHPLHPPPRSAPESGNSWSEKSSITFSEMKVRKNWQVSFEIEALSVWYSFDFFCLNIPHPVHSIFQN